MYTKISEKYATGNGVDCIVHLAERGVNTALVSVIGTDEYGREMQELCRKHKIDTSHLQVKEGKTSVYRMALKNGVDRVHVENIPGVMADYEPTQSDLEFVKKFEYVHTDLTGRVLHHLSELCEAGCKIIFDFSMNKEEENLKRILPYVHCAFFSCEKKQPEIRDFLKRAKSLGARYVVATFGEEGSMCYDGNHFYEHGIYRVPVVNTVGAGDSFIAGFSWGMMCGKNVEECLEEGARLSAQVVQEFNPY